MGTSTSNPGQSGNTPLVPSWLNNDTDEENNTNSSDLSDKLDEDTKPTDSDRFSNARNNFTRFLNSGGNKRYLSTASKSYVNKALGGAANATKRLGSALGSTERLISMMSAFNRNGITQTIQSQGLGHLVGKPLSDVFLVLIDYIVPTGGRVDEGISRDSLNDTITEFTTSLDDTLEIDAISSGQLKAFTETYIANVIQNRLLNDIGNNMIKLPGSVEEINHIQEQIFDFIQGAVSDSISSYKGSILDVNEQELSTVVRQVYKDAYSILGSIKGE